MNWDGREATDDDLDSLSLTQMRERGLEDPLNRDVCGECGATAPLSLGWLLGVCEDCGWRLTRGADDEIERLQRENDRYWQLDSARQEAPLCLGVHSDCRETECCMPNGAPAHCLGCESGAHWERALSEESERINWDLADELNEREDEE